MMDMENGIREYLALLETDAEPRQVAAFFLRQEKLRPSSELWIKPREFKRLEETFSKQVVVSYFSDYFQLVCCEYTELTEPDTVLWNAAHFSIIDYLWRNGKESLILPPLFSCIDLQTKAMSLQEEEATDVDPYFWNSYNRGAAYEDNSLFDSDTAIWFLPSYLLNHPPDRKEICKRYQQLIEHSELPIQSKEEYIHKLKHIVSAEDNDFYIQY